MIPLSIRRSSLRPGPGWLRGKCGSIFAHCSSLNQNKFSVSDSAPSCCQVFESQKYYSSPDPRTQGISGWRRKAVDFGAIACGRHLGVRLVA